jgi:hypothetical protein
MPVPAPAAIAALTILLVAAARPVSAQSPPPPQSNPSAFVSNLPFFAPLVDYFTDWMPRVTRIQSAQPHWITPLVTITPRLEQEYRYDQLWQAQPHGAALDNFGASKGLELIPWYNIEVILGVPGWIAHNGSIAHPKAKKGKQPAAPPTDGWADEAFLVKYRILAANEDSGNYILTAFMGVIAPTGEDGNSARHPYSRRRSRSEKDGAISTSRARRELRFPTAGWTGYRCPSATTPRFSIMSSNISGPSSKSITPGSRAGRAPAKTRSF